MEIDIGHSDGWYPPDAGPLPEQEPIVRRAQWILEAELAGDDPEVIQIANQISTRFGWVGLYTAMAAWCDRFVQHARGHDGPLAPLGLTIADPDPRPHVRWAIEVVRARAAWDRDTWSALLDEMPRHNAHYSDTVLRWIVHHMKHAEVEHLAPPTLRVEIEPVQRGVPHRWRDCRLRARHAPDTDPDEVARVQAAIDAIWKQLPGSDRRLIHGYVCHQRRDAISRQVQDRVQRQMEEHVTAHTSVWDTVRPTEDGVKLDLAPDQWSADSPDARLRMVTRPVAYHHTVAGLAHVSGLRWTTRNGEPVRTTAVVRTNALPAKIQLKHLDDEEGT